MTAAMNKLLNDITNEARSTAPIARFSLSVRARLEKYRRRVRRDIVTRTKYKSAPLFHACAKGKLEMVEYLISTCGADAEQKGWHGKSKQMVPPLWCATVSGKLPVVKCLISHGCRVDAPSDRKMTSLEAACFKGPAKLDVVEYLLQHGAKVNRRFHYGRTCLMQAVRNAKLCRLLLRYGANINVMDEECRTALHYAIESRRPDTVKLLLENNADPDLRSQQGDDALRAAVLYGSPGTVHALTQHKSYPPERLADIYELSGSCLYIQDENERMALKQWRKAIKIRNSNAVDGKPLAKKPPEENLDPDAMKKRLCYGNASEFTSLAELDAMIAGDWRAMRIQCMLINERILGTGHSELLGSIMETARNFTDAFTLYEPIVHLWIRALENCDACSKPPFLAACEVAESLVDEMDQLEADSHEAGNGDRVTRELLRFSDVAKIFQSLRSIFFKAWMSQKNVLLEKYHRNNYRSCYDSMAGSITYVIYWLITTAKTREDKHEARDYVESLIQANPRSIPENNTLLHFYVSTWYERDLELYTDPEIDEPYLEVTKLLLECGARVNARNAKGETPLHKAYSRVFSDLLNQLLVEHGAHLDTPDGRGLTPARVISANPDNTIDVESHTTLRCHAARAIARHEVPCNNLPASLQEFVDLHRRKVEVEEFSYSDE